MPETYKLQYILLYLLLPFSSYCYAQEQNKNNFGNLPDLFSAENIYEKVIYESNNLASITFKNITPNHVVSENFSTVESQNFQSLFVIDEMQALQQKIRLRFQTGLYSLKNNYILSANRVPLIASPFLVPQLSQNDLYQFGRFRTEAGYSNSLYINEQNYKAFLHSAYSLINAGRFDLSLTASLESITFAQEVNTSEQFSNTLTYLSESENKYSISATLGLVGSFDLSNHWSVIGALTTKPLTPKNNHILLEENQQNMAIIGTTYSF